MFFYSIFVQFLQFLVFDFGFGLVHYGFDPFNSVSNLVPILLKIMLA